VDGKEGERRGKGGRLNRLPWACHGLAWAWGAGLPDFAQPRSCRSPPGAANREIRQAHPSHVLCSGLFLLGGLLHHALCKRASPVAAMGKMAMSTATANNHRRCAQCGNRDRNDEKTFRPSNFPIGEGAEPVPLQSTHTPSQPAAEESLHRCANSQPAPERHGPIRFL
jgi:hypothetical protein